MLKENFALQDSMMSALWLFPKDYRAYYSDATRKIVEDVYAEDIRLFGYDFDNAALKRR